MEASAFAVRVPRERLFLVAGFLWTIVGMVLCARAAGWLSILPLSKELMFASTGLLLAIIGYRFGFSKVTQKNIDRIKQLPERAPLFAFIAPRGYIMIALMIATGILLRGSSLPREFLVVPYLAMGGVLILGSVRLYRTYYQVTTDLR